MAKIKVVIINGLGGCGKSTFIKLCSSYCLNQKQEWIVRELSTIDFVKDIARQCGWDGEKNQKSRDFLHNLKIAMENYNNLPNKKVIEHIIDYKNNFQKNMIFFVNIREKEGIADFEYLLEEEGIIDHCRLLIDSNKKSDEVVSIAKDIKSINYDYIINNNGTIEDFKKEAEKYIDIITYESSNLLNEEYLSNYFNKYYKNMLKKESVKVPFFFNGDTKKLETCLYYLKYLLNNAIEDNSKEETLTHLSRMSGIYLGNIIIELQEYIKQIKKMKGESNE